MIKYITINALKPSIIKNIIYYITALVYLLGYFVFETVLLTLRSSTINELKANNDIVLLALPSSHQPKIVYLSLKS